MERTSLDIQILVDNPNSWVIPYAEELNSKLKEEGHVSRLIHRHKEVVKGDILCLLSCERVFKNLDINTHNLVVHESDLPKGKGWSPVTWQILEGKSRIPVTLFEAVDDVDAGPVYAQGHMELDGTELLSEIKHQQGAITIELILEFVKKYPNVIRKEQEGQETYYSRRRPEDSELKIDQSILDQFNILRVCDNERYPAYFIHRNTKYILKVFKEND